MRLNRLLTGLLVLTLLTVRAPAVPADTPSPLANAIILIVRHAEKPDSGPGLTPTGERRAKEYVKYFRNYRLDAKPLHLNRLIATADTAHSQRPRLTLEPLSKALRLPIENRFQPQEVQSLVQALQSPSDAPQPHQSLSAAQAILICWHHKDIPDLLRAFGADPAALLPEGKWPDGVYGWVIQLRFDTNGHLLPVGVSRVNEHLLPDDEDPK